MRPQQNRLKSHGNRWVLLEASNGREATQISRQHQEVIDLLLTDVVMPGMRGDELVRKVRQERSTLAVIFISGYPDLPGLDANVTILEKPFTFPDLGRCVRSVLNEAQQETKKREKPRTKRSA